MPLKRLTVLNTRDCLWVYILRILTERPLHAYAIRKEIRERYSFTPGAVTAYKVLYLLRKSGHVEKRQQGRINVYSITALGRKDLGRARDFYAKMAKTLKT
ncbi:MAG: PadR family transcriptional regulator [Candidatus Thorarchaeota archaeon]|jgi:DNA-binding PadR family transcriptional regulator